jgi:hypothetical protein
MEKVIITLPRECYSVLPSTGEVILIKFGESGYYKVNSHVSDTESNQRYADGMNKHLGVSKAQEAAMVAGSMFGWIASAAQPSNYDEQGIPKKHTAPQRSGHAR